MTVFELESTLQLALTCYLPFNFLPLQTCVYIKT